MRASPSCEDTWQAPKRLDNLYVRYKSVSMAREHFSFTRVRTFHATFDGLRLTLWAFLVGGRGDLAAD